VRALELDNDRKQRLIEKKCPKVLRGRMAEFAAMKGTKTYETFRTGYSRYLSFVLQKQTVSVPRAVATGPQRSLYDPVATARGTDTELQAEA